MRRLLRGYLAALDPRLWLPMARAFRTSEGWCPPMMLIAVLGVVGFGGGFVRESVVATAFLYTWAFCWAVVSSIAASFALSDSFRNLSRLGIGGCSRARFWFELARSSCILGAVLALISFLFMLIGLPERASFGDLLLPAVAFSICAFFVASTLGYLRLLVSRQ